MVNIQMICVINSATIVLCVLLFTNALHTVVFKRARHSLYMSMLVVCMFQAAWYAMTYIWESRGYYGSYYLATASSSLLFIANAIFELLWFLYIKSRLFDDWKWNVKETLYVAIPAFCIIIGSIVNIFTPVFFRVDPVTIAYTRTPLFAFSQIAPAFYFGYGMYLSRVVAKRKKRIQFFPVARFMLPIVVAIILEACFYGMTLVPFACALALASLFISMLRQALFVDVLSGMYSRSQLTKYLTSVTSKRLPAKKQLIGMMIDIDGFKSINDTYGHLVGDDAIRKTGELMRKAMASEALGFRYGGDEFIILHVANTEEEALASVVRLKALGDAFNKEAQTPYRLNFSYGYSVYDYDNDTLDTFIAHMDQNMYIDKNSKNLPSREGTNAKYPCAGD